MELARLPHSKCWLEWRRFLLVMPGWREIVSKLTSGRWESRTYADAVMTFSSSLACHQVEAAPSGVCVPGGHHCTSLSDLLLQVYCSMGYCPQFGSLLDQMTVKETLMMYGRLRGVREQDLEKVVNSHINSLVLEEHVDKVVGKLRWAAKCTCCQRLCLFLPVHQDPVWLFFWDSSIFCTNCFSIPCFTFISAVATSASWALPLPW